MPRPTPRLLAALAALQNNGATSEDLRVIRAAFRDGTVTLAADQSVSVAGDLTNAVIVTGDGNRILLTGPQGIELQRFIREEREQVQLTNKTLVLDAYLRAIRAAAERLPYVSLQN